MNGIGGRTIDEAKERLTQREVMTWAAYIAKRGTLNTGRRLEIGFGQVMAAIAQASGAKDVTAAQFMPHEREMDGGSEQTATFDDLFNELQKAA